MLGIGGSSIPLAVENKAKFCFSIFHSNIQVNEIAPHINRFKQEYEDKWSRSPVVAIGVAGACCQSRRKVLSLKSKWDREIVWPVAKIVDTPENCFQQLSEIRHVLKLDEIIFYDVSLTLEDKIESYTNLSQIFQLTSLERKQKTRMASTMVDIIHRR